MAVKPILFNTEMVRAILDRRKTVTRRLVKPQPVGYFEVNENPMYIYDTSWNQGRIIPPYQLGDILYVREKFCIGKIDAGELPDGRDDLYVSQCVGENDYIYYEYCLRNDMGTEDVVWKPSIHMPKEAARIWLRVKDVMVERIQDITTQDICNEGVECDYPYALNGEEKRYAFSQLWDSTIKKEDLDRYGWNANPYVWVIEFERCEKPEEV